MHDEFSTRIQLNDVSERRNENLWRNARFSSGYAIMAAYVKSDVVLPQQNFFRRERLVYSNALVHVGLHVDVRAQTLVRTHVHTLIQEFVLYSQSGITSQKATFYGKWPENLKKADTRLRVHMHTERSRRK